MLHRRSTYAYITLKTNATVYEDFLNIPKKYFLSADSGYRVSSQWSIGDVVTVKYVLDCWSRRDYDGLEIFHAMKKNVGNRIPNLYSDVIAM